MLFKAGITARSAILPEIFISVSNCIVNRHYSGFEPADVTDVNNGNNNIS